MAIASEYYICDKCHYRTALLSRINDHLLEHSSTNQPYFNCFDSLKHLKCTSCHFSTEFLLILRYHVVHNPNRKRRRRFALTAKLKTCKKCSFWTYSNYLWIIHSPCKGKKGLKEKKKKSKVSMKKVGKWHLCEKCDYRTVKSYDLKYHIIYKHTPLDEVDWNDCNKCSARFKTPHDLKKHQRNVHATAVDHLYCSECDYSTPSRYNLGVHFNNRHTPFEETKFVECYHCGAKFKSKKNLKRHLLIHTTKGKQYKCDQCSFETHHQRSIKAHIVNRHLKKEEVKCEKLFKCGHCNFSSKYKLNVKNHILAKHTIDGKVFQCKLCSYNSRAMRYLTTHIRMIHNSPKFICEDCSFVTKTKEHLQRHMFNRHTVHTENIHEEAFENQAQVR